MEHREEIAAELLDVEREIRRLEQEPAEQRYERYNYCCVRQARASDGPVMEKEARKRNGDPIVRLAVAETMATAAGRRLLFPSARRLVAPEDIRIQKQNGGPALELCLLVDASGSMLGKGISEVKALAAHLIRQAREPLSLITFQEGNIGVKVQTTRDTAKIRHELAALRAGGLTPLGDAIRSAVTFLAARRSKKHLLILITDGQPTWAGGGRDPHQDAILAGSLAKRAGIRMICIGLEPERDFLQKLASAADASLYILADLNHQEMAAITRREKVRFWQGEKG